ncbi:hypothetical protein GGI25_003138 [Coemansia spiralis]|uniref:Myb-like domain-containing protein n=2 Tax=Coemansia TaxID=4863 RepID=A0A9W8G970_9FUNG|nr:hypothetical protein BX070DRAFT_255090 [Coemansia spiralis]KAJ1991746.1 hypothetical protein EDC05_003243 [Coemansia umbellata]KAJ2621749.1 hypothetical protein GGI26_003844 [Coemansia sp. RSA 1358]KAJ2677503.1 hypothetical protein GGI25_003138 [Coemansia spiralis]
MSLDAYQEMLAEPSTEELESIQQLVDDNFGKINLVELRNIIHATHPLCAEKDLQDAMIEAMSKSQTYQAIATPEPKHPMTLSSNGLSNVVILAKDQQFYSPENPSCFLSSRWTEEETAKLRMYLDKTQGRKDWTKCARFVGTKSNAQCKAKYNNMRASEMARDIFEI